MRRQTNCHRRNFRMRKLIFGTCLGFVYIDRSSAWGLRKIVFALKLVKFLNIRNLSYLQNLGILNKSIFNKSVELL